MRKASLLTRSFGIKRDEELWVLFWIMTLLCSQGSCVIFHMALFVSLCAVISNNFFSLLRCIEVCEELLIVGQQNFLHCN